MKWVYPQFLFALAVLIIPLLIHLFHFKRYKTVYFSSLSFLKSIEQEQRSVRKLKRWLIFAARAFAFTFFVFAFAQPYFSGDDQKEQSPSVIALYLDNSFSMSQIGSQGELLSQSREIARTIIEESSRNTRFILMTNDLSGEEKQLLTRVQCLEKLDKITYSPFVRSANDVCQWWNQWMEESQKNGSDVRFSKLVYLSDFQDLTFGKLNSKFKLDTRIYPVQLSPKAPQNVAVDSVWFDAPVHKKGEKQVLYALIRNEGNEAIKEINVNFRVGSLNRDVFSSIPAKGSDTVEVSLFNSQVGNVPVTVNVADKQMHFDDAYYANYHVRENSEILLVQGEDAVPNVKLVYELDPYYRIKEKAQNQMQSADLKTADLVVLNGVNQINAGLSKMLIEYAKSGGSLLLLPGSSVGFGSWNAFLKSLEMPSLGATTDKGTTVKQITIQDPFFEGVFEKKPEDIRLPAVAKAYSLRSSSDSRFVSLIAYQNKSGFFVRGSGTYSAYLLTTSLSSDFSTFTANQLFSTLLLRTAELSQRNAPYALTLGSSGYYPLLELPIGESPLTLHKGTTEFVPRVFEKNESSYISLQGLDAVRGLQAGIFSILKSGKNLGLLALNYSRLESKIGQRELSAVQQEFESAGLRVEKSVSAADWSSGSFLQLEEPDTLWKWCVVIAILFLLTEMIIVIFVKQ